MAAGETVSETVLEPEPIERLREMGRALGGDVPRRILELYLGDSPSRMASLRQALASGDRKAMETAAHALKGSSANLGASVLAEKCHQLERQCREAIPAGAESTLDILEAEFAKVELAMRELLSDFT